MPEAVPVSFGSTRMAPAWALGRAMPWAKVVTKPGMNSNSGTIMPSRINQPCTALPSSMRVEPASTMVSTETRWLRRLDTRFPRKNPIGKNRKYKPNSVAERPR